MATHAVLMDIDGTLVDSNYLHVEAWAHAFADVGAVVPAWRIHRAIGLDSSMLLDELLGDDVERLGSDVKDAHTRHYAELADRLAPLAGARELIRELHSRGIRVVLATSAPEEELTALRGLLDVEDALHAVTSSEDVETAKPEPDVIRIALERAGVDADDAVMVGDAVWDIRAAGRAGVRAVGVLSGGISAAELRDAGAVEVHDDAAALLAALDRSVLIPHAA
jgi:HAD superfamily hydrolase (TIGR01509 family)